MVWNPGRSLTLIAVACAALCCSSCGGGKKFYPVRGHVFCDGKPAQGVLIMLYLVDDPDAKPIQPSATVEADGSFELKSFVLTERVVKDGAPPGQYQVSCIWYPPDVQKYIAAMAPLPDKLHGKYADPKTSGLKATIPEQASELAPFELNLQPK